MSNGVDIVSNLNDQQLAIVEAPPQENMVVIAGAGTGKTRVIVSRIQRLIAQGYARPGQILAISFSKDARKELEQRFQREIPYGKEIHSGTFNSLGWTILKQFSQESQLSPNTRLLEDREIFRELHASLKKQYDLNFRMYAQEDSHFQDFSSNAAAHHNDCDQGLYKALYEAWQAVSQRQSLESKSDLDLPVIPQVHLAQAWNWLLSPSLKPDLDSQIAQFEALKNLPEFSLSVDTLFKTYKYLLTRLWNGLDKAQDFSLAQQWKLSLILNNGALDVCASCWRELTLWFKQRELLGEEYQTMVSEPQRTLFSIQELDDYVCKRKEDGAMPRIGYGKLQYYKKNLQTAWLRGHPCDLIRLKLAASDKLSAKLQCPFGKDLNATLAEVFLQKENEAAQVATASEIKFDADSALEQSKPKHHIFSIKQSKAIAPRNLQAIAKSCSCEFCPYFLDWYELFFAIYEEWRETGFFLDFAEQINRAVRLMLRNEQVRYQVQQRYKYIFVDEFQDTNSMQFKMLEMMKTSPQYSVQSQNYACVVGDDDQAIYGWRGADYSYLMRCLDLFNIPKQQYKILSINYRSHQNILNLANYLIGSNQTRLVSKRLLCPSAYAYEHNHPDVQVGYDSSSPRVNIVGIEDYSLEGIAIAQAIQYLHDVLLVPYHEIAVLYRLNYLSAPIEFALMSEQIPFSIKEQSFSYRTPIKHAMAALRLALDPEDDEAFIILCHCLYRSNANKPLEALLKLQDSLDSTKSDKASKSFKEAKVFKGARDSKTEQSLEQSLPAFNQDQFGKVQRGAMRTFRNVTPPQELESLYSKGKKGTKDLKFQDFCQHALEDIQHRKRPSLYSLLKMNADGAFKKGPKPVKDDKLKFFDRLVLKIDEIQSWNTMQATSKLLEWILEQTGVNDVYAKQEQSNPDAESNFSREELANLMQFMALGDMLDASESNVVNQLASQIKAQAQAPAQTQDPNSMQSPVAGSVKIQGLAQVSAQAQSPDSDSAQTDVNQPDKAYEHADPHLDSSQKEDPARKAALKRANAIRAEQLRAELNSDPIASTELGSASELWVAQRMRFRKLLLMLDSDCHAPWADACREHLNYTPTQSRSQDKVQLLSIHASKGREFKAVLLLGCERTILPHQKRSGIESLEEERRLAYVAFTRAKRWLFVTFCRNRAMLSGKDRDTGRSEFLYDVLDPWQKLPSEQRPYRSFWLKPESFSKGNPWYGQIDH